MKNTILLLWTIMTLIAITVLFTLYGVLQITGLTQVCEVDPIVLIALIGSNIAMIGVLVSALFFLK